MKSDYEKVENVINKKEAPPTAHFKKNSPNNPTFFKGLFNQFHLSGK